MHELLIPDKSSDIVKQNVEKLKTVFPDVFNKNRIDFNKLKRLLGDYVDTDEEKYSFTWKGKAEALRLSQRPSCAVLKPCKEESVNWDFTNNLFIEGDNLEVLKLLQNSYKNKIKIIYIDPPYNTGNDFVYRDNFKERTRKYKEPGSDTEAAHHTNWLNMMYPRLMAAKNLLTNDGLIFISIDYHELKNLQNICNEIFGEENQLGVISVINNLKGRSDSGFFATCNEFLLCYAKDKTGAKIGGFKIDEEEIDNDYRYEDELSKYKPIDFRKTGNAWKREERPYMYYPVLYKDGKFDTVTKSEYKQIYNPKTSTFNDDFVGQLKNKYEKAGYKFFLPQDKKANHGRWRWGIETFLEEKDINLVLNKKTVCTKMRATFEDGSIRIKSAKTLWYKPEYDTGSGSRVLKNIFDGKIFFENPKSLHYIKDILRISADKNAYVLDFFAGSGTTAHACMELNAEDGGKRKYIMVQLPELTDKNSNACKSGYKNICEIGKERLRRAGKLIEKKYSGKTDTGFKVFKLINEESGDICSGS